MENQLKLTKQQLNVAIEQHLKSDNGLNDLFELMLNGLMLSERSQFLNHSKFNKGNGYRSVKKPGLGRQMELRIPRDRLGVFRPVIMGLVDQHDQELKELSFALYGKGLTTREISTILQQVYGKAYSKSSVSLISQQFGQQINAYMNRRLNSFYSVIFIDALYLKVRRESVCTEAYYVLLGLKPDFTREVLSIVNLPTESAAGWQTILRQVKERGIEKVGLFVFDNLKGLDSSIHSVYPSSSLQKCILHFQRNLSRQIRVKDRALFCSQLKEVFKPDEKDYTSKQAIIALKQVLGNWSKNYPKLKKVIERDDLEMLFTYLKFDYRIRRMLYTTNWIERLNKSFKRTTKIRNALPTPNAAMLLLGYVAQQMNENTYKYPISNFKFDEQFNQWSIN